MALDQDNGLIYCADLGYKNNEYYGRKKMLAFDLDGTLKHSYALNNITLPKFIAINRNYDIIMSDVTKKCLSKFDKQGKYLSCLGDVKDPAFITVSDDDSIIVADHSNNRICIFNTDGKMTHTFGTSGTGKGQLKGPYGVATDGNNILVADNGNKRIQVFRLDGTFVSIIESKDSPLISPLGLAITGDGYVYVVDQKMHGIKKYKYKNTNECPEYPNTSQCLQQ